MEKKLCLLLLVFFFIFSLACSSNKQETEPPDVPAIKSGEIVGVNAGAVGFRFCWGGAEGASQYVIYKGYGSYANTSGTHFVDRISEGSESYRVCASNRAGKSDFSNRILIKTWFEKNTPIKKGHIFVNGRYSLFLFWERSLVPDEAISVRIYRWETSLGDYVLVDEVGTEHNYINDGNNDVFSSVDESFIISAVDGYGLETDIATVEIKR